MYGAISSELAQESSLKSYEKKKKVFASHKYLQRVCHNSMAFH